MNIERTEAFIRLKNISKGYLEGGKPRQVLQQVSVNFQEGEYVAILGRSGSGKSTLLNLISGIDLVDSGEIEINGACLTKMNEYERTLFRRSHIGFVFQFFNLLPTLTVLENISLPMELSGANLVPAREKAKKLLVAVGLLDRQKTFPDRLSGGEQQRVAIARALVHDPLLVLADEPTGNLDQETGAQVLSLLDSLTRQRGKNLIMVTHSKENTLYADRVVTLTRDGSLKELNGYHTVPMNEM